MAFDISGLSADLSGGHKTHQYRHPTDTVANMLAANYFDNQEMADSVKKGELITLIGSTGTTPAAQLAIITAVDRAAPTVTVAKNIIT